VERVKKCIRAYHDFPKKDIIFRDFLPVFRDPSVFSDMIDVLINHYKASGTARADIIVGLESRGFLFGTVLALKLKLPFVPIRKRGKLPGDLIRGDYDLEYGSDAIEIQKDAIKPGMKCLIVDDLLATGGSLSASVKLIAHCKGIVSEVLIIIELEDLKGREKIPNIPIYAMIKY